jgi:IS30 family transposase
MAKFEHLSLEEREHIQILLGQGVNLNQIAVRLGRDRKTIAEEIQQNRTPVFKGGPGTARNNCAKRKSCRRRHVCERCFRSGTLCSICGKCNEVCDEFVPATCARLEKAPFCCNGCNKQGNCVIKRYRYEAAQAHKRARQRLSDARSGLTFSEEEIAAMDAVVSPLIRKGQSPHVIYVHHADELLCSERTLYTLINNGFFRVGPLDLERTVQRRLRPRTRPERKVDKRCRNGRTYDDYISCLEHKPDVLTVEMDCVESAKPDLSCLLTMTWPNSGFILVLWCPRKTSAEVYRRFIELRRRLGRKYFELLFSIILTDRGTEFSDPQKIEALGTKIFYCDPQRSDQKPHIEQANSQVRRIVPKGSFLKNLRADDTLLISSHLNSYARRKLNGRTPYHLFREIYGVEVLHLLGIKEIACDQVTLKPSLLGNKLERKP